eukprot:TRINITY_DN120747_c0_g1_i1.p1 TRINITY_DN120747_c0_g1~~TRINITY_DN120747_c0_g1_i1.p1  ORF type:complete len:336 (+),score=66.98 TRINITY_DN120747_c0_g1_i1:70-1008(+)
MEDPHQQLPGAPPGKEPPLWKTTGVIPLRAPPERPLYDERWRPKKGPEQPLQDRRERTWKAVSEQCLNSRIPGYTGFIPSQRAEDVFGGTQFNVGQRSVDEQARRRSQMEMSQQLQRSQSQLAAEAAPPAKEVFQFPDEHPLGRSKVGTVRSHWVPTIPGYAGHIPGKYAESICGGGMTQTCKSSAKSIADRAIPPEQRQEPISIEEYGQRSRVADMYGRIPVGDSTAGPGELQLQPSRVRQAANIREHLDRQIPGYMGFIPRSHGESIYGGTAKATNLVAADYMDDRILNPESHHTMCCKPQLPMQRKLRL